jgi:RecA-family ATPase
MPHSFSAYAALTGTVSPHIVQHLLPENGALNLFAPSKGGKSYWALQLAAAIADPTTASFMGFPVKQHGPVLYMQIDTPRNLWIDRLSTLHAAGSLLIPEDLWFLDRSDCPDYAFNILNPEHSRWLRDEADAVPWKAIVVDVIREMHEADENDSTCMKRVMTALKKATDPAALIILSHSRKPSRDNIGGLMHNNRGSNYMAGKVDSIVELRKNKFLVQGRTIPHTSIAVRQSPTNGLWVLEDDLQQLALQCRADHPTSSQRELAGFLHVVLEGRKSLEACRMVFRRLDGDGEEAA